MLSIFKKPKTSKKKSDSYKKSYSQSGEDLVINFIFNAIGITHPSYLDIGAYDPYYKSY